jgi:hypothetical protein
MRWWYRYEWYRRLMSGTWVPPEARTVLRLHAAWRMTPADAHLIAAAPALYEACAASVAACQYDCNEKTYCGRCEPLLRALALARRGEKP